MSSDLSLRDRLPIFRACYETIFRHCIYNADPHPGNYLLHENGSVTFLDFGCVRRFDPEMIEAWKDTARATTDGDRKAFEEGFARLGLAPDPKRFDWDHQWRVMQYIYQPFTTPGFTYTHAYVRKSYDLLLFDNPNRNRSGMPPAWLFLNRLQWGLNAVLAHLQASGPWPDLWRAAVESPTEPAEFPTPEPTPAAAADLQ